MSQSDEHKYLSTKVLEITRDFSHLQLYGYKEPKRGKFDFACDFYRDRRMALVGQVFLKNYGGIDKDIRTLLTESGTDILAYLIRDTYENRNAYTEAIHDFHNIGLGDQMCRLKPFWIPEWFSFDNDQTRKAVEELLKNYIVQDILFNVIFGNLTSGDIRFLLGLPGIPGLFVRVLYEITTDGFAGYSALSRKVGISVNPVREKVLMLLGGGLLSQSRNGFYHVPLKGRVFLDLLGKLSSEMKQNTFTSELKYILYQLKLEPVYSSNLRSLLDLSLMYEQSGSGLELANAILTEMKAQANQNGKIWGAQAEQDFLMRSVIANAWGWPNQYALARLLKTVYLAEQEWSIDFNEIHHKLYKWEEEDAILWERNY